MIGPERGGADARQFDGFVGGSSAPDMRAEAANNLSLGLLGVLGVRSFGDGEGAQLALIL